MFNIDDVIASIGEGLSANIPAFKKPSKTDNVPSSVFKQSETDDVTNNILSKKQLTVLSTKKFWQVFSKEIFNKASEFVKMECEYPLIIETIRSLCRTKGHKMYVQIKREAIEPLQQLEKLGLITMKGAKNYNGNVEISINQQDIPFINGQAYSIVLAEYIRIKAGAEQLYTDVQLQDVNSGRNYYVDVMYLKNQKLYFVLNCVNKSLLSKNAWYKLDKLLKAVGRLKSNVTVITAKGIDNQKLYEYFMNNNNMIKELRVDSVDRFLNLKIQSIVQITQQPYVQPPYTTPQQPYVQPPYTTPQQPYVQPSYTSYNGYHTQDNQKAEGFPDEKLKL